MDPTFTLKAKLWLWSAAHKGSWHFITIPEKLSKEIKGFNEGPRRGFGSVRVKVTIGSSTWKTSIFPEKKGTYVLPIKASVRKKEGISEGDTAELTISLI